MDPTSKDNANPTVLDASTLPSRTSRPRRQHKKTPNHCSSSKTNGVRGGVGAGAGTGAGTAFLEALHISAHPYMDEVLDRSLTSDGNGDKATGYDSNDKDENSVDDVLFELVKRDRMEKGRGRGSLADEEIDLLLDDEGSSDDNEQGYSGNGDGDGDRDDDGDDIDEQEIYDLIAPISDPEHPLSLGSLAVVNLPDIHLERKRTPPSSSPSSFSSPSPHPSTSISSPPSSSPTPSSPPAKPITKATVLITPTITHCSLATVIGLAVRVRLEQALPPRFRVCVEVKRGTHTSGEAVTKQLADKERVAAALENAALRGVLGRMMSTCA